MNKWCLLMVLSLTGCGSDEHFSPGKWELQAWMENPSVEKNPMFAKKAGEMTEIVELSKQDAAMPPASVFVTRFYHGIRAADLKFKGGEVSGTYEQSRVDDIAGHDVPIKGTYGRDKFKITLQYAAFGAPVNHVIQGKLVKAAP